MSRQAEHLTEALARWRAGDRSVEKGLMDVIYPILRALAQKQLRAAGPMTLQATELANEAFIRLRANNSEFHDSKENFLGFMARVLRNLIVDHIRSRSADKRGGSLLRVEISELNELIVDEDLGEQIDWLALDRALTALEAEDPAHAQLVELRYFLGYSMEKCAEHLQISQSTANRMWRFAKAFLFQHIKVHAGKSKVSSGLQRSVNAADAGLDPRQS